MLNGKNDSASNLLRRNNTKSNGLSYLNFKILKLLNKKNVK